MRRKNREHDLPITQQAQVLRISRGNVYYLPRLWRSVKYEEVYLRAYDSVSEACASIGQYLDFLQRSAAPLEP